MIATSTCGHFASTCNESLFGIVLTLYSAEVSFLLCDRFLPACLKAMSTIFTRDASSSEEYFRILDQLPLGEKLADENILRARKYAYHFFLRRMIPPQFMEPFKESYKPELNNLNELVPGKSKGLDVICNGIINGADFIYPAERITL